MADVRLTATNPEDSSVVPVACDAAGRLLLEEPQVIEGPPGPPGEQGPPGQDGDPFSGNFAGDANFAGDVNFGGSASFANTVDVGDVQIDYRGTVLIAADDTRSTYFGCFKNSVSGGNEVARINRDGNIYLGPTGAGELPSRANITLSAQDGSVAFAGNKAGFTAEGYLWCTTRRGDTVILDATSNGLASWVEYTPTTRLEEIRDKLDAFREETPDKEADTQ